MLQRLLSQLLVLKKRGFFHLVISNYSVQLIVFGAHMLLALLLTPEDLGIIKLIETIIGVGVVLGAGGAVFALLKLVPMTKDGKEQSEILGHSIRYMLVIGIIVFVIFNTLSIFRVFNSDESFKSLFATYSLIILPSVIMTLLIRYYQALEKFKRVSTLVLIIKLISIIIILSCTYFYLTKGYVVSTVFCTVVGLALLIWDLRRDIYVAFNTPKTNIRRSFSVLSRKAFTAQVIDQIKLHSGFLIISYLIVDREQFGQYAFALIIIQGLNILSTTVQQFVIPKMSSVSENIDLFFKKFRGFEKRYALVGLFIATVSWFVLPVLVQYVFDAKYDLAIDLLYIMLVGWLLQSFFALKGVVFLSLGKMEYVTYGSSLIFVIAASIIYILTFNYGVQGAAYGYVIQSLISWGIIEFFVQKSYKETLLSSS